MEHIMGIEMELLGESNRVRVKFVAIIGEIGPELNMPINIARDLLAQLKLVIGQGEQNTRRILMEPYRDR